MSVPVKLLTFAVILAVLFAGGALAGGAIDPDRGGPPSAHSADPVRGLAVEQDGLRIVVEDPELLPGRSEQLRYRIVDEDGRTVPDFEIEHERRMHLIVARRDLTGFQHLHPEQAADGSWTVDVTLDEAGSYRLFADFVRGGESYTLADDLRVDGPADLRPLPAPSPTASAGDGYEVRLEAGEARPGEEAEFRFAVTRDGESVRTEPYLGAGGHLVALREGDLAFLHVHPIEHGDAVGFAATLPTAGRYGLFLQFKHAGRVHTAAFTQEIR